MVRFQQPRFPVLLLGLFLRRLSYFILFYFFKLLSVEGQAVGRFLNATGESGDQKQIYTPLAHFVEKMRIYEKRPKSQKRKQLEKDAER